MMLKKKWRKLVRKIHFYIECFEYKHFPKCENCGAKLDKKDEYHMRYRFCDVSCGMELYGLSPRDFY